MSAAVPFRTWTLHFCDSPQKQSQSLCVLRVVCITLVTREPSVLALPVHGSLSRHLGSLCVSGGPFPFAGGSDVCLIVCRGSCCPSQKTESHAVHREVVALSARYRGPVSSYHTSEERAA